ncbi:MAG: asparagine synthase-related protein [Candidatus Nanoarchaeia archaeon]|nr:asparagine synthase-related protein [Candidatus Nanoarchaeia archaeon]
MGILQKEEFIFIHNLLALTGNFTPQPIEQDDIVVCFNGEIYGYREFGNYDNDTKCIIPLYKEYGIDFVHKLDGEYAIILIDFKKRQMYIITDLFSTKPIFIATDGKIGISSYKTPLQKLGFTNIQKVKANTIIEYNINDFTSRSYNYHTWNLKQYKDNFSEWNIAFENSIRKRTQDVGDRLFMGLSSGFDSGAILCCLLKQGIKFKTYSNTGSENMTILNKRLAMVRDKTVFTFTDELKLKMQDYIKKNAEDFIYTVYSSSSSYNEFNTHLYDDSGAIKQAYLCQLAKQDKKRIMLSGSGGDEVFSDYGMHGQKIYEHSNFAGVFPKDLNTIFPWASFYGSSQESYLMKDEIIGGSYSIECRFPILDREVVQQFLNLTCELKNKYYKNAIRNYLVENNFPFAENEKRGF